MKLPLLLLLSILFPGIAAAQDNGMLSGGNRQFSFSAARSSNGESAALQEKENQFFASVQNDASKKSPLKAVILSAIIPGAGHWYNGSKYKAVGFAAAETALWFGRSHFIGEGDKIEREFRTYADQFWSITEYNNWKNMDDVDITSYSHILPTVPSDETIADKTQQYYELIGKYNQFLAGWPDSEGDPDVSEMRLFYEKRQHDSNKNFKRADTLAQVLILNRVVSAFDAAYSISRKNKKLDAKIRYAKMYKNSGSMPVLKIKFTW